MTENKNIKQLILLAVLVAASAAVFFFQNGASSGQADPTLFHVEELSKIDRVELKSAKGTVKLSYNNKWLVNDQYDADRQRVTVLFATIEKAVPRRPVAAVRYDTINSLLNDRGVAVTLYEGDELKKQFTVGGDAQKNETYFRDATGAIYIVNIPGYRVYVAQAFELEANDWRDTRVFGINWEDFKSLSEEFPLASAQDFTIEKKDGIITMKEDPKADTGRVFSFLDDVSYLIADRIVTPGAIRRYDSLAQTAPAAIITVRDIADRSFTLKLFAPLPGDPMLLGITGQHGLVLLDQKRAYRILRKRSYFTAR